MCVHFDSKSWLALATVQQLEDKLTEFDEFLDEYEAEFFETPWMREHHHRREQVINELKARAERGAYV